MELRITVEGVTPILFHKFTDAAQISATEGNRASSAAADRGSPFEQAEAGLHVDLEGKPVVPQAMMFGCIIGGGSFFKAGKSKITTQRSSLIPACLAIHDLYIPIESKAGWKVDSRPVRMPSTGGRILRHRPMFDDWRLTFTAELDEKEIGVKLFRSIIDAAGNKVGIGDYRPATRGPYGRFKIVAWDEIALPEEEPQEIGRRTKLAAVA